MMEAQYTSKERREILFSIDKRFRIIYESKNWFYAPFNQPIFPFLLIVSYLLICMWIGPAFMKNRSPFRLKKIIIVYDYILAALNLYVFIWATYHFVSIGWEMQCSPDIRRKLELVAIESYAVEKYMICCYGLKLFELLDTVFFVVTKKDKHISFLHLFHHTITPIGVWYILHYDFGATYWGFVMISNSFVHVLMYAYYGLVASGFKAIEKRKKLLTRVQIIQFILQMLYVLNMYISGCINDSSTIVYGYMVIFVVCILFINFYIQNFLKKSQ